MIKIAVLGHGVVGSGVLEVFYKNKEQIEKKVGKELDIKYVLDLRDFPDLPYSHKFTKDFNDIINDDEISVVAEVIGGLNPAYRFVKESLLKKKSVVTSNKELVAAYGDELLKIAKENGVNFFFEASVGGGIPVIKPLYSSLGANKIEKIAGILNGTTNFILTKMISESMSFPDALKLAQDLGYAERNPEADVEGHDACRKICILAAMAFGEHIYPNEVETKGITEITLGDAQLADMLGYSIKLIGLAKKNEDGKISICVSPMFVSKSNMISGVNDVFNCVMVTGSETGDVLFYGKGAGKNATASAVVSDIMDACSMDESAVSLYWDSKKGDNLAPKDEYVSRFFVKTTKAGAEALFDKLGGEKMFLNSDGEWGFISEEMSFKDFIKEIEAESEEVSYMRVL